MFLYDYLYNSMYSEKYSGIVNNRTRNMNKILGGGLGLS